MVKLYVLWLKRNINSSLDITLWFKVLISFLFANLYEINTIVINLFHIWLYMEITYGLLTIIIVLLGYQIYYDRLSQKKLNKSIKESIEPKFLDIAISPESQKLISLAIDIWRLEWKIDNSWISKNGVEAEKIRTSLERLKKFTNDYGISIKDFIWEKYVNEINFLELKWTEDTADSGKDWIIKDTIEPVVYINWTVVKTAKVIVYKFIA